MPIGTATTSAGTRVLVHTCEVCGAPACFGYKVDIRAALRAKSKDEAVAKGGQWYCERHKPE